MAHTILVLGGTGFVGRSLCEALVARTGGGSGRIVVPSRRPQRATHLRTLPTLELIDANVHDDASLRALVRQADAVVNLVAILHGDASQFEQAHVMLPLRLAQICQAQGVQRLIHVSALGVKPPPENAPSLYLRSKSAGEVVLRTSKWLQLTVLRPSVIFGEHDRFVNLFASLQRRLPVMPLADSDARFQPVWVEDVVRAIVHSLDTADTIGQTLECAGPQVMSLADIVRCAGLWSGHPRPILPLPHWAGYVQAGFLECLPGQPLMSRDNVASMTVANVATDGAAGLRQWGITPTAMNSVMPAVLGHGGGPARFNAWRRRGSL